MDELFYFRECDDFIEFLIDFPSLHTKNRTVQKNVFASRQFSMKARPDLQQRSDPTKHLDSTRRRFCNAREDFKQSTFPGAVATDKAHNFTHFYLKENVFKGPNVIYIWLTMNGRAV